MIDCLCLPVGRLQANCWLVWENGEAVAIDPGDEAPRILRALKERDLTLKAILLTHGHFDHILAADALRKATGAPLICHPAETAVLADPAHNLTGYTGAPFALTADRTVADGEMIAVGTMSFTVIHTPGHTPGGCCFALEDHLFTGDTLFAGSIGRTDFPGGDPAALNGSLHRLKDLPDDWTVHPGHGETTTLDHERATNPFMVRI